MEALTFNSDTQTIAFTEADNGLSTMSENENLEQSGIHENDDDAVTLLSKFGLKLSDITDKLKKKYRKAHHTQIINNGMNYTGGKYELLPIIKQLIPDNINHFYDACAGAGTMGVNIDAKHIINNEIDNNLLKLTKSLSENSAEYNYKKIFGVLNEYDLECVVSKEKMFVEILNKYQWSSEPKNLTITDYQNYHKVFDFEYLNRFFRRFKQLTSDYNNSIDKPWEMFYVLVVYSFDNTIKYSYEIFKTVFNERNFSNSLRAKLLLFSKKLVEKSNSSRYTFENYSYTELLKNILLKDNDFLYFNPPYFITTNAYTTKYWKKAQEVEFLKELGELKARIDAKKAEGINVKFGLSNVIHHRGETNEMLINFINENKLYVHFLPKTYDSVAKTSDENNVVDTKSVEVYVTNYPTIVCPKHIHVPMEYDKLVTHSELIQTMQYDSECIQGRFVISDINNDKVEIDNIIKHNDLSNQAILEADGLEEKAKLERLQSIKSRFQIAISAKILKAKHKGDKGAYTKALAQTPISISKAQRYMKLMRDTRVMALSDKELLKIPRLTYTKLVKMSELLNDEDFEKVVEGNLSILPKIAKDKITTPETEKDIDDLDDTDESTLPEITSEKVFDNHLNLDAERKRQLLKSYGVEKLIDIIEKQRATIEKYEKYFMVGSSIPKYPAVNNAFPKIKAS